MNEKEINNLIKRTFNIKTDPKVESFSKVLSLIEEDTIPVTKDKTTRYNIREALLNIINNKTVEFVNVWKSKRVMILIPTFIVLFVLGTFSLSPSKTNSSDYIIRIAEQNESINEQFISEDEEFETLFDSPAINDLDSLQYEI